jgi:hypothetical protein
MGFWDWAAHNDALALIVVTAASLITLTVIVVKGGRGL